MYMVYEWLNKQIKYKKINIPSCSTNPVECIANKLTDELRDHSQFSVSLFKKTLKTYLFK